MERKINLSNLPLVIFFLLPGLLIFVIVAVIPSILAISYSFYEATDFISEPEFLGLQNYATLLVDTRFWNGVWRTFFYAFATVFLQIVIGIIIALILNQEFKGRDFIRGVSVVPYIIPVIVVTIGWEWMLDTNYGIINAFVQWLGFDSIQFLSIDMAMYTAIMLSVWTWTPFVTLVFLSGLQTISNDLYESSTLDGANKWQQFWRITLPMMKNILITIVLLRGLWMFNKFDVVWLLTGGGPLQQTETLPVYSYLNTFNFFNVGYGTTIAVASGLIMLLVMLIYLKIFSDENPKVPYQKRKKWWQKTSHQTKSAYKKGGV